MNARRVVCLDLGSTYTKGALLEMSGTADGASAPRLLKSMQVPTSRDHLALAALLVVRALLDLPAADTWPAGRDCPLYAKSSAKGGLSILAVGLVPDLTLKAATLAACSAGGRVAGTCAYGLTPENVRQIECTPPDIVLLTGGTDGGNERFNLENARRLAASHYEGCIVYAGNAHQREAIATILSDRDVHCTDNLMPEVGILNIDPTRALIQKLFMHRIVEGKGLADVAAECAAPIRPTPAAVFDLVSALGSEPEWDQTLLLDMGGATTDVYSIAPALADEPGVVLKGLAEPRVKRSVEGDLGMRISAAAAADGAPDFFDRALEEVGAECAAFEGYLERCSREPGLLPAQDLERHYDALLAEQCLRQALLRHAGTQQTAYTASGKVRLQHGKDLRRVRRIVGSGGYLAALRPAQVIRKALAGALQDGGGDSLLPQRPRLMFDEHYRLPVAAALAVLDPRAAGRFFQAGLCTEEGDGEA